jgi:hypothetical protein
LLGETEAARGVLAVGDDAVNTMLLTRKREMLLQRLASRGSDDIADNEQIDGGLYDRALALAPLPE